MSGREGWDWLNTGITTERTSAVLEGEGGAAGATSSSYPPSSDSMTKVPTWGMATSTVRWAGPSPSAPGWGGGEGDRTPGWGERGLGGGDCGENWTQTDIHRKEEEWRKERVLELARVENKKIKKIKKGENSLLH